MSTSTAKSSLTHYECFWTLTHTWHTRCIKGNITSMREHAELLSSIKDDITDFKVPMNDTYWRSNGTLAAISETHHDAHPSQVDPTNHFQLQLPHQH
ncbi:hypothetical protein JHK85_044171 [Glycine max]|nr:hypothetical protein JHK85_044171 [Glycine max]